MDEKIKNFLEKVEKLAREKAPAGSELVCKPLFPTVENVTVQHGIELLLPDGRSMKVIAQEHAFSIERSGGFFLGTPWYVRPDPLGHVEKELEGFFAPPKKKK